VCVKFHGDGNGSDAFGDGITYYCHMCMYELEKQVWAIVGFSSEAEMLQDLEAGTLVPRPAPPLAAPAHLCTALLPRPGPSAAALTIPLAVLRLRAWQAKPRTLTRRARRRRRAELLLLHVGEEVRRRRPLSVCQCAEGAR
jgi:hypothetical protein